MKRWFDLRKSVSRDLEVGDLVLKWDKEHEDKGKHTKFQCLWLGPFIITRFSVPGCLIFDNATYFSSAKLTEYALDRGIKLKYSANYYPQGNGLAESSNKNLIKILKRTVANHHRNWHTALSNALWADRVTPKAAIGNSPFFLVYG